MSLLVMVAETQNDLLAANPFPAAPPVAHVAETEIAEVIERILWTDNGVDVGEDRMIHSLRGLPTDGNVTDRMISKNGIANFLGGVEVLLIGLAEKRAFTILQNVGMAEMGIGGKENCHCSSLFGTTSKKSRG